MLATVDINARARALPHLLAEALEAAIIFGEMEPGARIIEEEIAAKYNVSRSPVRDALRRLETDGLVLREERRGARVAPVSQRDLDEVYVCRKDLEGLAAELAAVQWAPPAQHGFADSLRQMQTAFASNDVKAYFGANVAFTEAVHRASHNVTLERLLKSIGKQALRYRFLAYRAFPHLMGMSIEGNRDIVGLIARRDGKKARMVTERLIERSWQTIRECVPAR